MYNLEVEVNNNNFRDYEMYKSENTENVTEPNAFLDQLTFQKISDDDKTILDSPLTPEELYEAIGNINRGKAPGPWVTDRIL